MEHLLEFSSHIRLPHQGTKQIQWPNGCRKKKQQEWESMTQLYRDEKTRSLDALDLLTLDPGWLLSVVHPNFVTWCFTKYFLKEPVTHCHRNKNPLFQRFMLLFYTCNYWLWQTNPTGNSKGQSGRRFSVLEFLSAGAVGTLRSSHPVPTAHSLEQNSAHHLVWFNPQNEHWEYVYTGHDLSCLSPAARLLHSTTGWSSWRTVICPRSHSCSEQDQNQAPRLLWQSRAFLALGVSGSLLIYMDRRYEGTQWTYLFPSWGNSLHEAPMSPYACTYTHTCTHVHMSLGS